MAYTPIGWTESTLVNATNLDKMDGQIDTNEQDIRNIEDGTTTVEKANNAKNTTIIHLDTNYSSDNENYTPQYTVFLPPPFFYYSNIDIWCKIQYNATGNNQGIRLYKTDTILDSGTYIADGSVNTIVLEANNISIGNDDTLNIRFYAGSSESVTIHALTYAIYEP